MQQGWSLRQRADTSFDRDYFLPLPTADWGSVRHVMAGYADTAALNKDLLRRLRRPVKVSGRWTLSEQPLLWIEHVGAFWSEHSERNWMVSMLAAIGVERAERDFVGRWGVSSGDEYLRTA